MKGWFRRMFADAVVEGIPGARMRELDGQVGQFEPQGFLKNPQLQPIGPLGRPSVRIRMHTFVAKAMHCNIILNLLIILDLPHKQFEDASLRTDAVRLEVGGLLAAASASEAERKEAGKTAINAVVYQAVARAVMIISVLASRPSP